MPPRCRSCGSSMRAAPTPEPRIVKDFDAADISDQPFGWNLPNWLLRREMVGAAGRTAERRLPPRHRLPPPADPRQRGAGHPVRRHPRLGPPGRSPPTGAIPPIRAGAGHRRRAPRATARRRWPLPSPTPIPHQNVSTEIHRSGGPFTLVPLPDRDGQPCLGRGLDGNRARGRCASPPCPWPSSRRR